MNNTNIYLKGALHLTEGKKKATSKHKHTQKNSYSYKSSIKLAEKHRYQIQISKKHWFSTEQHLFIKKVVFFHLRLILVFYNFHIHIIQSQISLIRENSNNSRDSAHGNQYLRVWSPRSE